MMRRFRHPVQAPLVLTVLAGLTLSVPAVADQIVYFVNGKAITVKNVERGDKLTILEIEGGGRIGVPTAQIDRIEELQLAPPAAAAVAPPVAAAPPSGGAQVAPVATGIQTAAPIQQQPVSPAVQGSAAQPPVGPPVAAAQTVPGASRAEGAAAPVASPGGTEPFMRQGNQPVGQRQMGLRRDGAMHQPGAGLKRPARGGGFRNRSITAFQSPAADRQGADRPQARPQGQAPAAPAAPPAEAQPSADQAPPPEANDSGQFADEPSGDEASPAEPDQEADDPGEER